MLLYHYTSLDNLQQILDDKRIKTSPSNLLKPINPHLINGKFIDETDTHKPVVWFTSLLDFEKARACGLTGSIVDKTEAAICINSLEAKKWAIWATQNNIDKSWFKALKASAPMWETFYIVEHDILFDENTKIVLRPDIMENFKQDKNNT